MQKIVLILFILLFMRLISYSQITKIPEGYVFSGVIVDGDTLASIQIKQVVILPPLTFDNKDDILKYKRLIRNVKKAYPYAMIAKDTFLVVQKKLNTMTDKREKKRYMSMKEDELKEKYAEDLKKLTISQGRILIKLIDRELNQTSYEIIKQFRGSLSAFFWQQIAKMFGEDLKSNFDAEGEDLLIDRIVIMIENGQI